MLLKEISDATEGSVNIPLVAPEDPQRGKNAFTASKTGYFLAGWTGEATHFGCSYSLKNNTLTVDAAGTYNSAEPVLTLKAVWLPLFEVEFYDLHSMELLDSFTVNPTVDKNIKVPRWDENTGRLIMQKLLSI